MIVTAYLTKNEAGNVELWKTKPYYDETLSMQFWGCGNCLFYHVKIILGVTEVTMIV